MMLSRSHNGVGVTQGTDSQDRGRDVEKKVIYGTAQDMAVRAGLRPQLSYTVAETAKYTGVPRSTIYKEIRAGRLKRFLIYGTRGYRITCKAVDEWIERGTD